MRAPVWHPARTELGNSVRRVRERSGLTGRALSRLTGLSQSHISRIERGIVVASERDISRIASACGLDQRTTRRLMARSRKLFDDVARFRSAGGPESFTDQAPRVSLERRSNVLHSYDAHWLPGLLQTPDCAASVFRSFEATRPEFKSPVYRSESVDLRLERQSILLDSRRQFRFVFDESVLHTQCGNATTRRLQRTRLLEVVEMPNVELLVLPAAARRMTDTFVHLGDVVILETHFQNFVYSKTDPEFDKYERLAASLEPFVLSGDRAIRAIRADN